MIETDAAGTLTNVTIAAGSTFTAEFDSTLTDNGVTVNGSLYGSGWRAGFRQDRDRQPDQRLGLYDDRVRQWRGQHLNPRDRELYRHRRGDHGQ